MWLKNKVYKYIESFIDERFHFMEADCKTKYSHGLIQEGEPCYTLKDPDVTHLQINYKKLLDQMEKLENELGKLRRIMKNPNPLSIYSFRDSNKRFGYTTVVYFDNEEYLIDTNIHKLVQSEVYPEAGTADVYDIYLLFDTEEKKRHYIFCPKLETVKFVGYVNEDKVDGKEE